MESDTVTPLLMVMLPVDQVVVPEQSAEIISLVIVQAAMA
jgi:hypothetical protein